MGKYSTEDNEYVQKSSKMSTTSDNDVKDTYISDEYVPPDDDTVCSLCMAEFIDPDDLEMHLNQVHNVYKCDQKSCQFCTHSYTDLMDYALHIRDYHITKIKRCQYCSKAFIDVKKLVNHEKKHKRGSNKRFYNCSQCTYVFNSTYELKNHEYGNHDNNNDGIMLNQYLPYLSAALNIKASTFLQYVGKNTVFICVGCDYTTDDVELYIQHAQSDTCVTYVCNKCSNTYKKKGYMRRHLSKECGHQAKTKIVKICPECGGAFHRQELKIHKKTCNNIKCYVCQITFNTMYELSEHQSNKHPLSIEVKSCKFCGKQSVGTVALQKHIDRSHKHELHMYKYLCIYCNNAYKHPQKLFGHFFSKHKEINPYTCKICNLEFRPRKKFTIHIKLKHNSEGFVEFDKNYHVFFTDKKSDEPFVPKSIYTDMHGELEKREVTKKSDNNIKLVDCTSVTETEGNITEVESEKHRKSVKERSVKAENVINDEPVFVQSSDDEPLLLVRKRAHSKTYRAPISNNMVRKRKQTESNKKKFTCNVCKKYCYTYQNYNHHMTLHSKNDAKECILCSKKFRSKRELAAHVSTKHSSSRLTDTLKNLIKKRQSGIAIDTEVSMTEKFKKTIKKVDLGTSMIKAKITPVESGLSVQKFIENFSPEENKNDVGINNVTMKLVSGLYKKPTIKITKFDSTPLSSSCRLTMPIKFKDCYTEKANVTVKIVQPTPIDDNTDMETDHYYDDDNRNDIPEVAEEVMLEGTEEPPKQYILPHKIVIDKLPMGYKDIRIAHMLPQAPFYKIIKVQDVLKKQDEKFTSPNGETIKLPDGTKLVSSNPLAHLLGDTTVEKFLEPTKNKYYKPRVRNFESMLAKALAKLDTPTPPRKKKQAAIIESAEETVVENNEVSVEETREEPMDENSVVPIEENSEVPIEENSVVPIENNEKIPVKVIETTTSAEEMIQCGESLPIIA